MGSCVLNPISTALAEAIGGWLTPGRPLIVGLCGTQASGKSTACAELVAHFAGQGLNAATLSLDDLYLGRAQRTDLASRTHKLFATRGPPGTHDVALGIQTLDAIRRGEATPLPRFDKRGDIQLPATDWPVLDASCDLVLFEGWCVGAIPQPDDALSKPVNDLEREEDPEGVWRRTVNHQLGRETGTLFTRLDRLAYLRPPSFETVFGWRCGQEHAYIASDGPDRAAAAMTDDQVARFIAHYERLTCWIMDEMPGRADLTIQLDSQRQPVAVNPT